MSKATVVGSYIVALVMDTERIPLEGEIDPGSNYHTIHGGKGSNMAACAARLGAESAFMGMIGKDSFVELMKTEGVHPDGILYTEHLPTIADDQMPQQPYF
jgi:ribokinase